MGVLRPHLAALPFLLPGTPSPGLGATSFPYSLPRRQFFVFVFKIPIIFSYFLSYFPLTKVNNRKLL